jgi:hypothetical protein
MFTIGDFEKKKAKMSLLHFVKTLGNFQNYALSVMVSKLAGNIYFNLVLDKLNTVNIQFFSR